jgi:hypothetical protein
MYLMSSVTYIVALNIFARKFSQWTIQLKHYVSNPHLPSYLKSSLSAESFSDSSCLKILPTDSIGTTFVSVTFAANICRRSMECHFATKGSRVIHPFVMQM